MTVLQFLAMALLPMVSWSLSIKSSPFNCRTGNKACRSFSHPAFLAGRDTSKKVFVPSSRINQKLHASQQPEEMTSSYDIDDEAEQTLATRVVNGDAPHTIYDDAINGYNQASASERYASTLEQFSLTLPTVSNLPSSRPISPNDVFCNRELKLDTLKAVGFDMDYTLAQYQQPAFDKLAFDGAKEKLVHSLGYPVEVLNFEYDHTYWVRVELKDYGEHDFLDEKTYEEIYRHIRECVDLCHRDGVIKDEVARDPEKYLVLDKGLVPMLKKFRENGVKVFLLTNSYWEYTSTAMNYLFHEKKVDMETQTRNEWLELFDLVVVGSCKPAYLTDPYLNLFRVVPENGSLRNTDGLFEIEALGENGAQKFLEIGKTFQGGNWNHLQAMLDIEAGEEILYVGDHLYADVLRSKRALGWRSCFIMPELPEEMRIFEKQLGLRKAIMELRNLRQEFSQYSDMLTRKFESSGEEMNEDWERQFLQIEDDDAIIKEKLADANLEYHSAFHPRWGQMFVAGYQDSRFGYFVKNYACLYTSKATNLGQTAMTKSYRTSGELLPHDNDMKDEFVVFVDEGDA
eukprot:scaffold32878_cov73-Cyclotella_meneghiniana.AAC.6